MALCVYVVALTLLAARPAAALAEASGLYQEQHAPQLYRWTASDMQIPIHGRSGPTLVVLTLGPAGWPGRSPPIVTLNVDAVIAATFVAPAEMRRYHLLLPPNARSLSLSTTVDQPLRGDGRWLGVPLFGLTTRAYGLPLRAATIALLPALASMPLALAAGWCVRRGYGPYLALAALALLPRVTLLDVAPPGFSQDEAVSLVDAWHLARTGRDHLGNAFPFGAQEAFGDWISPLLTYLELPLAALWGPDRLAGRLTTALVGAMTAPLSFTLARRLGLPLAGALAAGVAAALSPWQIFLSRFALPPSLAPTSWMLCLLAALLFVQQSTRRTALLLALTAGVSLYSYPTMKLAAPLLVGWAALLALLNVRRSVVRAWLPSALLLVLLWAPFGYVTLFNPASDTRMDQTLLRAESAGAWMAAWWRGYSVYFGPQFYFVSGDGDLVHGLPDRGVELPAIAPLLAIGLAALLWYAIVTRPRQAASGWRLVAGAVLIAPLPASLTVPSPHAFRAAIIAPMCALLVGIGAGVIWRALAWLPGQRARFGAQALAAAAFVGVLAWQSGAWFRAYIYDYPSQVAVINQDGLREAMARTIAYAPGFNEVWISYDTIAVPYIYLLAAQPMPPAQSQAAIRVLRRPAHFNHVAAIGRYRFADLSALPQRLPALAAIPGRAGAPGYVLQAWLAQGRSILIVRRIE